MKKMLIALVLTMCIPISVKADTSFGIDATWANYKETNDCVWVMVYKVPYAKMLPSDYNGIIKYDSNAFNFNYTNADYLSQFAGDLLLPCDGCVASNNEDLGEVTLSINQEIDLPTSTSSAPKNILLPFQKKESFDNSKQYEFTYDNDKYGEVKVVVKFDENGKAEVISATGPRFDFVNAQMEDGSKKNENSEPIVDESTPEINEEKEEKVVPNDINESDAHNSDDITVKVNKKGKKNTVSYIIVPIGLIVVTLAVITSIVVVRLKKKKAVEE